MTLDHKAFFDRSREKLGHFHQKQVEGMERTLEGWEYVDWSDLRWLAYALSTAWWETGHTMQPIEEVGRGAGHIYGLPAGPDKLFYYGRGLVQLTWYSNYVACTEMLQRLGFDLVDLAKHPEQACEPSIATLILLYGMEQGRFTGGEHTFAKHFPAGGPSQPVAARQIVNGLDAAAEIATVYADFCYGLGVDP